MQRAGHLSRETSREALWGPLQHGGGVAEGVGEEDRGMRAEESRVCHQER